MPSATKTTSTNAELQRRVEDLQRQIRSSEGRLRAFLSLSHQTFCCLEFDPPVPTHLPARDQAAMMISARVADCNAEFAQLCGADEPSALIGTRFLSLFGTTSESLTQRAVRLIQSAYRIDGAHNTETLHDGSVRHFVNSSRGEVHDGHLRRVWITGRDVTWQALIEAASREGDVELRRTAEELDSAFWVMDWHRFEVLYTGPAVEERWGVSRERLLEEPLCWLERVHEHDRQRVRNAFLTHAGSGAFDETFRVSMPDGSVGWVRNHCFVLPNRDGAELQVIGLVQNITESVRGRAGFNTLFRVSTEMLFVIDVQGRIEETNSHMTEQLGYEPVELTGTSLLQLLPVEQQSAGRQALSKLASGDPAVEIRSHFLRKDHSVCPVEWNAAPASEDGRIYAAARNISGEIADDERSSRQIEAASRLDCLSPRERQIVQLVAAGKANKMIARELDLSQRTVEKHRANLMKKLNLRGVAELVQLALQAAD